MNKNKMLLIIVLAFTLLLGGAYVLYNGLAQKAAANQMSVQGGAEEQTTQQPEDPNQDPDAPGDDPTEPNKVLAPDFTVYDAEGNEVNLSDFIGKPIVLNFWASWCGPCQGEMPDFHKKYLEHGDDVHFLMINRPDGFRETVETASAFVTENGYTFPVLYDTESDAAATYGAYSMPTTFFLDADGYVITYAVGPLNAELLQIGIDMISGHPIPNEQTKNTT